VVAQNLAAMERAARGLAEVAVPAEAGPVRMRPRFARLVGEAELSVRARRAVYEQLAGLRVPAEG
jgi:hypothetical protein